MMGELSLWRISQDVNDGYDTYDSAVVCAETEDEAKLIHPSQMVSGGFTQDGWMGKTTSGKLYVYQDRTSGGSWCYPESVTAEWIGTAAPGIEPGVIVASFNAG